MKRYHMSNTSIQIFMLETAWCYEFHTVDLSAFIQFMFLYFNISVCLFVQLLFYIQETACVATKHFGVGALFVKKNIFNKFCSQDAIKLHQKTLCGMKKCSLYLSLLIA